MSKTQQTVENFHPTNPVVDLRPEGHEDKARQAEIDREKLLAQQRIESASSKRGMGPTIRRTANPSSSDPAATDKVFLLGEENNTGNLAVQAVQPADIQSEDTSENSVQPKKPGFFKRLLGKE
ncbi:MAG: hypothetical protein WCP56_03040 [Candidatus Saccharibacteria bacterium]